VKQHLSNCKIYLHLVQQTLQLTGVSSRHQYCCCDHQSMLSPKTVFKKFQNSNATNHIYHHR